MADMTEDTPNSDNKEATLISNVPDNSDNLVSTAIKFLLNPKVLNRPLEQKRRFLKSKGLTDEQIEEAIRKSGTSAFQPLHPVSPLQLQPITPTPVSFWIRARDTSFVLIILVGTGYGLYKLYLNYVKPFLFEKEEESETERALKALNESVQAMQQSMTETQEKLKELVTLAQYNQNTNKLREVENLQELKAEVSSLKGLLLNRKSFPPLPNTLPAWQMQQNNETINNAKSAETKSDEKQPDISKVAE